MKIFVVIIAALAIPLSAGAQPYPNRAITLVVPYTPGTGIGKFITETGIKAD